MTHEPPRPRYEARPSAVGLSWTVVDTSTGEVISAAAFNLAMSRSEAEALAFGSNLILSGAAKAKVK